MSFFVNKKVIVTGGSKGIGRALVEQLLTQGAIVGIISRKSDQALIDLGAKFQLQDLAKISEVATALQSLIDRLGGVDILVNSTGMAYVGNLSEMSIVDFQKLIDLNLTSVWQSCIAVLPTMRSQHQGKIINIASIAAKQAFPGWGAYSASKFALLGLTQALAAEESANGIQVMSICPGSVDTPLWDSLDPQVTAKFNRAAMLKPDTVAATIMTMLQLPSTALITDLVMLPNAGIL